MISVGRWTLLQAAGTVSEAASGPLRLATLGPDGPTGKVFHFDQELPW